MAALRCSRCGVNWPPQGLSYAKCPRCEERTSYLSDAEPIDHAEAEELKAEVADVSAGRKDVSALRAEYDAKWAKFQSGPPPADPRQAQHRDARLRRWPEFERLCTLAEARKVHCGLRVKDHLAVKEAGKERRDLYEIVLVVGGKEISSEFIRSGDLDACAKSLQPALISGQP